MIAICCVTHYCKQGARYNATVLCHSPGSHGLAWSELSSVNASLDLTSTTTQHYVWEQSDILRLGLKCAMA